MSTPSPNFLRLMKELENPKNAAKFSGSKGGKNGTGVAKTRNPKHYRRMAEIRRVKRLQRMLGK